MNRIVALLLSFLLIGFSLSAQSLKELEAKKKKTLESLALTNKLLDETQKSKTGTVNQINLLKRSIKQSNEMLSTLNNEISLLDTNIDSLQKEQQTKQLQLDKLKSEYAKMVRAAYYQRHTFSPLLFILSADDFSQGYRRFRYLQEMAQYRKEQGVLIEQLNNDLARKEFELSEDRIRKETSMSLREEETRRLESQSVKESRMLSDLKKKESELKLQQKKQQQQADQLNNKIQEVINAEIRRQNELAKKKKQQQSASSKKTTPSTGKSTTPTYTMSKDEQLVAGNFERNKGKLPLPVAKGVITGHFGIQPHPVLSKVTINNKGIYIQTPAGSDARAIFEGEVTQVFSVQGSNSAVIVKHGNYRTVYSNLTSIYVKVGDKVTTKQKLGRIFTDSENENKTELYLMVYKNTEIQNPEAWLAH